jgi:hypothetical protein
MSDRRCRARRSANARPLDAPLLISGLAAWYDLRSAQYVTIATGVSAMVSRAGSLGLATMTQGTTGNQPAYATGVASLRGQNALLFDGTDDWIGAATASDWTFLHNNSGATIFTVERIDSTGPANQIVYHTFALATANAGIYCNMRTTSFETSVGNASGTSLQNNWTLGTAAHYAKDVSRWRAWTYGGGAQGSAVSGSTVSNADIGGQSPSSSAPLVPLRLSRASVPLKGYLAQVIVYAKVLSATEISRLAVWANQQYGVTV